MARLRYLTAGAIACLLHGLALSYAPQKNTVTMSTEKGAQSLQVQLMTFSSSQPDNIQTETQTVNQPKPTSPTEPKKQQADPKRSIKPKPAQNQNLDDAVKKEIPAIPQKEKKEKTASNPRSSKQDPVKQRASEKIAHHEKLAERKPSQPKKAVTPTPTIATEKERTNENNKKQPASQPKDSQPKLVKKPQFRAKPTPVSYPRAARKRGLEGKVLIEVWIDKRGQQIKQLLLESSGHRMLDERALKTVREWRFSYQSEQGQAIAHRVQIPINFQLK
ncbi:energy transducer TonB [Vibrio mytili]|uniref:energy transducer TonB n=1 Tax=Vibrio mytili TaxID=50718 RepID=UPI003C6EF135